MFSVQYKADTKQNMIVSVLSVALVDDPKIQISLNYLQDLDIKTNIFSEIFRTLTELATGLEFGIFLQIKMNDLCVDHQIFEV